MAINRFWTKALCATTIGGALFVLTASISPVNASAQTAHTYYVFCYLDEQDSSEGHASQERAFINDIFVTSNDALARDWDKYIFGKYHVKGPSSCEYRSTASEVEQAKSSFLKRIKERGNPIVTTDWKGV